MKKTPNKPSAEAKALSLFLMAYKTKDPIYKEKSKRINRLWSLVKYGEMRKEDYVLELDKMIKSCGGYLEIVEKTVQYYIDKTGKWKLEGDDKYCQDAKKFADKILNK